MSTRLEGGDGILESSEFDTLHAGGGAGTCAIEREKKKEKEILQLFCTGRKFRSKRDHGPESPVQQNRSPIRQSLDAVRSWAGVGPESPVGEEPLEQRKKRNSHARARREATVAAMLLRRTHGYGSREGWQGQREGRWLTLESWMLAVGTEVARGGGIQAAGRRLGSAGKKTAAVILGLRARFLRRGRSWRRGGAAGVRRFAPGPLKWRRRARQWRRP